MKKSVKVTIIVVVVLVGLLVAADYGLAAAAEYQVSKKMRAELGLTADPSVDIHGFPFVTQAISGDYSDISINATGVPAAGTLRDLEVDADLHHVRVGLSDLLSGNVQSVRIDEVDGQVKVKASDLGRLLQIPDLTINPVSLDTIGGVGTQAQQQQQAQINGTNPNSTAGIQLTGTINIAGQRTQVSAYGVIALNGGNVQITARKLTVSNGLISGQLPDSVLSSFLPKFGVTLSTKDLPLPFTVTPTGVVVENGDVVVQGMAQNVLFSSGNARQ